MYDIKRSYPYFCTPKTKMCNRISLLLVTVSLLDSNTVLMWLVFFKDKNPSVTVCQFVVVIEIPSEMKISLGSCFNQISMAYVCPFILGAMT